MGEIFVFCPAIFLSHVYNYMDPYGDPYCMGEISYFCNARVADLGEIFVQRKFSAVQYTCAHQYVCNMINANCYYCTARVQGYSTLVSGLDHCQILQIQRERLT